MSSCWPLFIGSCTGSGETAYEGALCRGSRGLLLVPALRARNAGYFLVPPTSEEARTVPNCAATRLADSSMKSTLAYPAIIDSTAPTPSPVSTGQV